MSNARQVDAESCSRKRRKLLALREGMDFGLDRFQRREQLRRRLKQCAVGTKSQHGMRRGVVYKKFGYSVVVSVENCVAVFV